MFCKTPFGAKATATVFSLIETAKANDLDSFKYLVYIFEKLSQEERYGEAARTTVILSFNKKATAKTQQQLQEIQTKMRTGKEYKLEEICEITGLKRTRTRDLVKKLVVMGIVDESGDRKARRYKKRKQIR